MAANSIDSMVSEIQHNLTPRRALCYTCVHLVKSEVTDNYSERLSMTIQRSMVCLSICLTSILYVTDSKLRFSYMLILFEHAASMLVMVSSDGDDVLDFSIASIGEAKSYSNIITRHALIDGFDGLNNWMVVRVILY